MFFAKALTLFVALASSVAAAPTADPKPEAAINDGTPLHLRTTWAAVNGTLHNLKARGIRIQFGETNTEEVVWSYGSSQCAATVLTSRGLNPCGRQFTLQGVSGLTLEGCGGSGGLWIDQNGQFYEDCVPYSEPDSCGVHTEWTCL